MAPTREPGAGCRAPAHRRRTRCRGGDAGFATVEYVAAVALSMVVCVLLMNFIVFQYGRGVVRAALDEGVRAGAREPADGGSAARVCAERAQEVRSGLLGGAMGEGVRVECWEEPGVVRARAEVVFGSWVPAVFDDYSFESLARASTVR